MAMEDVNLMRFAVLCNFSGDTPVKARSPWYQGDHPAVVQRRFTKDADFIETDCRGTEAARRIAQHVSDKRLRASEGQTKNQMADVSCIFQNRFSKVWNITGVKATLPLHYRKNYRTTLSKSFFLIQELS